MYIIKHQKFLGLILSKLPLILMNTPRNPACRSHRDQHAGYGISMWYLCVPPPGSCGHTVTVESYTLLCSSLFTECCSFIRPVSYIVHTQNYYDKNEAPMAMLIYRQAILKHVCNLVCITLDNYASFISTLFNYCLEIIRKLSSK